MKQFRFAVHWAMVLIVAASLATLFRYQYFDMERRIDRWTGEPQSFYQGRWLGRAEYEDQWVQEAESVLRTSMH